MKQFLIFILTYLPAVYALYKITYTDLDDLRHGLRVIFTPSWIWTRKDYDVIDVLKDDIKTFLFVATCIGFLFGDLVLIDKLIGV